MPTATEHAGPRNKEWAGGKIKDKRTVGGTAGTSSCKRQIIDEMDDSPTTSKLSKYENSKELYKDISLSQAIKSSQSLQKSIAHNSHLKMFKQRFLKMETTGESKRTKKKTPSDLSSSSSSSDSDEDDNMEFDEDNQDDSTSSGSCSSSSSGSDSSESSSDSSEFDNEEEEEEDNFEENDDDDCDSDKSDSKSNIFISQIPVKKEISVPAKNYSSQNNKARDEHWGFAAVAKNRVDIFSQSRNIESDGFALKKCGNLLTGFNKSIVTDELSTSGSSKQMNYKSLQSHDNMEAEPAEKRTPKVTAKKEDLPESTTATEAAYSKGAKKTVEKLPKKKVATLKSAPLDTKRTAYKSDDDEVPYLNESTVIKCQLMENTNYARSVKSFTNEESSSNEKVEYEEVYPENPFGMYRK